MAVADQVVLSMAESARLRLQGVMGRLVGMGAASKTGALMLKLA